MNCLLSGFQSSYINKIIEKCDFLEINACIYIDDKTAIPDLKFSVERNDLRAGKIIENNLYSFYDSSIIKQVNPFLTTALTLFDRYDVNNSISISERLRIIYTNTSYWISFLTSNNINIIVSREIPHFQHEYCLYIASKILNVQILMFDYVEHLKRTLCVTDINKRFITKNNANDKYVEESKDLLNILRSSYAEVVSNSKVPTFTQFRKKWSIFSWVKYITRDILSIIKNGLNKSPISILLSKNQYKKNEKPYHFSVRLYFFKLRFKVFFYELIYNKLSNKFNLEKYKNNKIIVFYGNYQPERTTNPDGGDYFNILNVLTMIKSSLPKGYVLLYKEHPHTFSPPYKDLFRGVLFRDISFYKKIIKMGIILVPTSFNTYTLINHSKYSASINGTVLIESIVNNVESLMFGNGWIESLPGILKIKDNDDLKKIVVENTTRIIDADIIKVFSSVFSESISHLNLLNDQRSFNCMDKEVEELLKYIKDRIEK